MTRANPGGSPSGTSIAHSNVAIVSRLRRSPLAVVLPLLGVLATPTAGCGGGTSESEGSESALPTAEGASGAPSKSKPTRACTPDVSGLTPTGAGSVKITCPSGYEQREAFSAMPVVGRFTNVEDLIDA